MKKRREVFFVILVLTIFVSSFLGGAYSQYRCNIAFDLAPFIPSEIKNEIRTTLSQNIDNVLLKVIEQPPAFSYNGDYETFKNDFEKYKYTSFGFPAEFYQEFLNSNKLGDMVQKNSKYI